MGWERRKRGGLYYTRSRKLDGRVVRQYIGTGLLGEMVAVMDAQERAERKAEAAAWRGKQERLETADGPVDALCEVAEAVTHGALILAGYYRHHRGEWRRRRGQGHRTGE